MSELRAQVVVVGGGPAGSVTALLLARAGVDVLLLDRAAFPREKACGDCLSARATRLLAELDLLAPVLALRPARLQGWRIRGPGETGFTARFRDVGDDADYALAVPRYALDQALLDAAREAGARVHTEAAVSELLVTQGGVRGVRFRDARGSHDAAAHLVIGADGLRSRVARRLGAIRRAPRLRKLSFTAHLPLAREPDGFGEMHAHGRTCVGLAPVAEAENVWNVTVVADANACGRAAAADPLGFFAGTVRDLVGLVLPLRVLAASRLLASGPFDSPVRRTTFDGAVLVGDAAGYYDPFTGQGVYQALAGAAALAPVAADAVHARDRITAAALEPYRRAHLALVRGPRRVQQAIEMVLARPTLAQYALRAIGARPHVARTLLGVTGDMLPAGALLSPRLALSWLVPHNR